MKMKRNKLQQTASIVMALALTGSQGRRSHRRRNTGRSSTVVAASTAGSRGTPGLAAAATAVRTGTDCPPAAAMAAAAGVPAAGAVAAGGDADRRPLRSPRQQNPEST